MSYFIVCLVFYLIGSFPTAYLLVKLKYRKRITDLGSGNVGARNTFEVTNSKTDGIIVLLTDFMKGLLPVLWFVYYSSFEPSLIILPAVLLLAGHNFSVWLKFKGGRGLATAAGIMAVINFTLIIIWLSLYFVLNRLIKNVHVSTVISLILLPLSVIILQSVIINFTNPVFAGIEDGFRFLFSFTSAVCIVILFKHISPILDLLKAKNDLNK
ncbi:MAG TPA: glycerol-3-phosphate acyltransferase [Ignavibacteria bacterium]|nr:glycerol-3-phosphate acyltransferase [Ignavibacteria bacterium]HMR40660.1 glycerol-3-phosphate acyltransferase [Ignavibacteria bacterium]